MKITRLVSCITVLALIIALCPVIHAEGEIKILINNQPLYTENPPVIIDGRTLV